MNSVELEKAGKLLFGEQWQSNLAEKLNIDSRRVRHWMAGTRSIPHFVNIEVAKLLEENQVEIKKFLIDFDNEQSQLVNHDYVMIVHRMFEALKLKADVEDKLFTRDNIACIPTQRLVDECLSKKEKDMPTPSIICFLKDGVWHADLLTKYNRSKDETIFWDAVIYTNGKFSYDLIAHEAEKHKKSL